MDEGKKQAFIKLLSVNEIDVELRDSLEENGEQINYAILGVEDGGTYVVIEKVLIHSDADIDIVMDEVSYKINQYLELKNIMRNQTLLN